MTTRRRIAWIVGVVAAAAILSASLDSAVSGYLYRSNNHLLRNVALDQARAANYRRPIVVGTPLSENAATKYRSALANFKMLPKQESRELGALVNQGLSVDLAIAAPFLHAHCAEIQSREFRDALRCTRCDWQLSSGSNAGGVDALFLGNCLLLSGHSSGRSGEWRRGAQWYVEALAFACDLGQGDFSANLVGIALATSALRGLTDLLDSAGHDAALVRQLAQLLPSDLADGLPSVRSGIGFLRIGLAAELISDAQSSARSLNRLGLVVPGTAFAVWRLRRHEAILDKLERVAAGGEVEQRVELARQVRAYASESGSEAFKRLPTIIPEAILSAEVVQLEYGSVRAQLFVHQWRLQHGSYPTDEGQLPPFVRDSKIQYEPIDGGKGYRIVVARGYRTGEVLTTNSGGPSR